MRSRSLWPAESGSVLGTRLALPFSGLSFRGAAAMDIVASSSFGCLPSGVGTPSALRVRAGASVEHEPGSPLGGESRSSEKELFDMQQHQLARGSLSHSSRAAAGGQRQASLCAV
ncbi:hypothetical protein R6Z07M_018032 [Ovis aries]